MLGFNRDTISATPPPTAQLTVCSVVLRLREHTASRAKESLALGFAIKESVSFVSQIIGAKAKSNPLLD